MLSDWHQKNSDGFDLFFSRPGIKKEPRKTDRSTKNKKEKNPKLTKVAVRETDSCFGESVDELFICIEFGSAELWEVRWRQTRPVRQHWNEPF